MPRKSNVHKPDTTDPARKQKPSKCKISLQTFEREAVPAPVTIQGNLIAAYMKEYSKGSFGWRGNEKMTLRVGEHHVHCQINCNIVIIGSAEAPRKDEDA